MKRAADELGVSSKEQTRSLRNLEAGEFFAFGPAITRHVTKIKIGGVKTTHPKAGARIGYDKPASPTPKIKSILEKLSDLPKEAEEEARTLAEQRAAIKKLKAEIRRLGKDQPAPSQDQIDAAVNQALAAREREFQAEIQKQTRYAEKLKTGLKDAGAMIGKALDEPIPESPRIGDITHRVSKPTVSVTQRMVSTSGNGQDEKPLVAGALRMLKVLVSRHPMLLTKSQLATFARLSPRSGTFGTYLSTLRSRGYIADENGHFQATEEGIDFLGETPSPPQTPEEVIDQWRNILQGGARRMFDILVGEYPRALTKEELGERADLSHNSGTFGTYLSTLRSNGLAETNSGMVKASDNLFI
jgi:hypothetical protein